MATESKFNTDGWTVVLDDDFVYKSQARRLDPTTLARNPDPLPDPAFELREKKKIKRQILLQLKDKYHQEILRWELLSNTLKDMELRNSINPNSNPKPNDVVMERQGFDCGGSQSRSLLSEALLQVEAQEGIIQGCTKLCEVVESLCSAHEENAKQHFFDLSVWKSPRELMAGLSED